MYVYFNNVEFKVPVAGMSTITWSPPAEFFSEGVNSVSIRYDDFAQTPGESWVFNLILDTTAPNQPRILYAADDVGSKTHNVEHNGRTDDESPMLTGLAERNSLVNIYNAQHQLIGSVKANDNGFWEIELPLGEGEHALYVTATDKMGHVSQPSDPFNITVGPDAALPEPGIALITHAWDDAGTVATGRLESGALTDDTTPTLHGTAPANSTVEIQYRALNGSWISGGSVTALADGSWSWKAPELADGSWEFRARTGSGWADEFALEINRNPQESLLITHAEDDFGLYTGKLSSGSPTDDRTPTLHGRAEANSIVYVHNRVDGGAWELLGSARAGADGSWTLQSERLATGNNDLVASNSSSDASGSNIFSLDILTSKLITPLITGVFDDTGLVQDYLINPGMTDDRTPTLEGRAPAGALVVIYQDDRAIGSVYATDGRWHFTVPSLSEDKSYSFSAALRDGNGNDGSAGREVTGTLNRELARGERLLVNNGFTWLEAVVEGRNWRLVDPAAHSGSWEYYARVEDAVSGTTPAEACQEVIFDNQLVKPAISGVYDYSGSSEQLIPPDGTATDSTPLLRGTAESGSLVYIYREGTSAPIGSVKAENGQWQFIASGVTPGANSFYVRSTDAAGNSDVSERYDFSYSPSPVQVTWDFNGLLKPGVSSEAVGPRWDYPNELTIRAPVTQYTNGIILHVDTTGRGYIGGSTKLTFEFNNPIYQFEFDLRIDNKAITCLTLYDQAGKVIETVDMPISNNSWVNFKTKFYDTPINKISYYYKENYIAALYVDNFKVSYLPQSKTSQNLITDETNQDILDDSVSKLDQDVNTLSTQPVISASTAEVITVDSVLEQGFSNFFIDNGTKQLLITGNEGDTVQLDDLLPDGTDTGDWIAQNGTVTVAGVEYQVFSHSDEEAEVLIQQGIKTELI